MRVLASIFLVVLLAAAGWRMGTVELDEFQIREEGSDFVVTWSTSIEVDVKEFDVQRRTPTTPNGSFVPVKSLQAQGVGRIYVVRDSQVFKSGQDKLDYRLEVVYSNGVREVLRSESVNYSTTVLRRTWGSLKAMFQ